MKYTLFQLTKELRGRNLAELSTYLRSQLDEQPESFASEPRFRLHMQNYRQVRHVLARLTHWLDSQCGLASHFEDLVSEGRARPFEIEHIWADKYEQFAQWFPHPVDFDTERNRIGGLLLLQRGINQSLGGAAYEQKRDAYLAQSANLLARSLHPLAYKNNPSFKQLLDRTGLPFRAYDAFDPEAQHERQELYIRLAEWVWNPSRLDLDGEKPPIPEPIHEPEEVGESSPGPTQERHLTRLRFWTQLLEQAKASSNLHANISPSRYHWIGARKHGMWWNYSVTQSEVRVELYIDTPDASTNKALFDALHVEQQQIDAQFGTPLSWQRLDDKRASRICHVVSGGWADESSWPTAIKDSVAAMNRLYAALSSSVKRLNESGVTAL